MLEKYQEHTPTVVDCLIMELLNALFICQKNQKGTGYWKLNTSYLENDDYVKGIKDIIQNVINNVNGSHIVKWETLKYDVKQFSLKFAKQFQKNIKKKILYLEEAISNIEDSFSGDIDMTKKKKTRTGIV